jgi:hypothetical protein
MIEAKLVITVIMATKPYSLGNSKRASTIDERKFNTSDKYMKLPRRKIFLNALLLNDMGLS